MFDKTHLHSHLAVSFIDTLRVFYRNPLSKRTYILLQRNCCQIDHYDLDGKGVTYVFQQPNRRAIAILDRQFQKNRDFINAVDIALDITMPSFGDAYDASYFCRVHMRHRYSHESPNACEATSYSQRRRWYRSNLVSYPVGRFKMLKDDALHIEWRFKSAKNAKRIGITRPGSLLRFDAEKFWCDRWLFETFTEKDMIRAARLVAARTNDSESRMLIIIRAASVCDEEGNISAGAFRYFCGLLRLPPDRYLHRLEIPFPRRFRWCFDEHTN